MMQETPRRAVHDGARGVTFLHVLLLGIFGPALALIVTWQSAIRVANISARAVPAADIVKRLRTVPDDSVLRELREVAVSYPGFYRMAPDKVLELADKMLAGKYVPEGLNHSIGVPFEPEEYLFGHSGWHLDLHSFLVPSLLGRAYEISGEIKYIQAAVQYILDWARYESSLLVPRGYFFNDHALAARSIVVTEIWRLYRESSAYQSSVATDLLHYVQKLSRLLLEERLYEYRTNHGLMQSLSLLHLAIAFPLLDVSKENLQVGKRRLLSQLEYYVNDEGVILEHSPGYHQNGLGRLAAAGRYLGLLGEPVPADFVSRYRKSLDFLAALRRPDRTLPPIGDTDDRPLSRIQVASFDHNVALEPLHDEPAELPAPSAVTVAPGAGWVILWDGLSNWPNASKLTQTVFHWGNFPTGVHKHADELGLSIWSHSYQWVRGVGHWPYNASRRKAIGWRSSNGPHWLNESPSNDRTAKLVGSAICDTLSYFDVLRINGDDSRIRRQLVKLGEDTWVIIDSFKSQTPKTAEIVWRFLPSVTIKESEKGAFVLKSAGTHRNMSLQTDSTGPVKIEADISGSTTWNSGMIVDGEKAVSPSIRVTSSSKDPAILTFFTLDNAANEAVAIGATDLEWENDWDWQVSLSTAQGGEITVERHSDVIRVSNGASKYRETRISMSLAESAIATRQSALTALNRASEYYGIPFQPMTDRRVKASAAIAATAIVQLILFFIVKLKRGKWWPRLVMCSSVAWIGLSLYLGMSYLA